MNVTNVYNLGKGYYIFYAQSIYYKDIPQVLGSDALYYRKGESAKTGHAGLSQK